MWRVVLALVVVESAAFAQEPTEASRLFEEGRTLAKDGNYAAACDRFAKSLQLDRASGTEVNLADCEEHIGHNAEAWRLFTDAAALSEKDRNDARAKLARDRAAALEPKLATVVIKLADPSAAELQVTVAGRVVAPAAEIRERVDAGPVEIVVTAPGRQRFVRNQQVAAGATAIVDTTSSNEASAPPTSEPATPGRARGRVHLAMGLGAGAVVTAIASLGFGALARSSYNDTINDPSQCMKTPMLQCTQAGLDHVHHAQSLADVGTAFGVVAVLLGAGAAVVYFTAPRETVVAPVATASGAGVTILGHF